MDGLRRLLNAGSARSRRIAWLLVTVWLLCLTDLSFTLWAHWFTPFHEVNPLARSLLAHSGPQSLVVFKVVLTLAGTGIFWGCRRRKTAELASWLVVAAYVMLAVQWSTYTQAAMFNMTVASF